MQLFFDTFHEYITLDEDIVLAVSGWVDSMVMFDLVKKCHPRDKIVVAHFDHSLRGDESDGDRELVANICKRENIRCVVKKVDIWSRSLSEKMNIEALARRERYEFLESVRHESNATYILTAHHAGDQLETVIQNLIKWGKIRWLSGMPLVSGSIFRPLLHISKKDILAYQWEYDISFREDSSNMDTTYDRNRIRHDIVPVLTAMNPTIDETIGELALYMQELSWWMTEYVEKWLHQSERISGEENSFLVMDFLELSLLLQGEVLTYLYARAMNGSTQGLSRGIIRDLTRFISGPGSSHTQKQIKNLHLKRRGERVFY